jgi:transposase
MGRYLCRGADVFIRRKANRGGSISIMLVMGERHKGKKHSTLRVIKNFGSSTDEATLKELTKEAQNYKDHLMSVSPKAKTLKITSGKDIKSCRSFNVGFEHVYGSLFNKIFSSLNLKSSELKKLQDLIVMRIAHPASKRKTAMVSLDYGIESQVDSIYKLMDKLTDNVIINAKQIIYHHTSKILSDIKKKVDVMFYDLTTVYFETNSQDALRDYGFSKDGKPQHVQIMLAVIVTKQGLPIDYQEFPGNCYEGHTLLPVIDKLQTRYEVEQVVLVADAALMNKVNLQKLTENRINYVIAARIKNTKKEIQKEILAINAYKKTALSVDKNGIAEDEIKSKIIELEDGSHLIAYHSTKRARKDEYDREKDIEKIRKYLNSTAKNQLTSRLKKPYITITKACKIEIDQKKLNNEKAYDGFFGLQTNLEKINPKELLDSYRGLWQVEQTFRIAKSNLEIRPVFHYNTKRIKAHFLICYISLALMRYVEFKLRKNNMQMTCDQIHYLLNQIQVTQIHHNDDTIYELLEDTPKECLKIYQALNLSWLKKFSHRPHL